MQLLWLTVLVIALIGLAWIDTRARGGSPISSTSAAETGRESAVEAGVKDD